MLRLERSKSLVFTEVLTALRVQEGEGGSLVPSSKSEPGWSRITAYFGVIATPCFWTVFPRLSVRSPGLRAETPMTPAWIAPHLSMGALGSVANRLRNENQCVCVSLKLAN